MQKEIWVKKKDGVRMLEEVVGIKRGRRGKGRKEGTRRKKKKGKR